MVLLETWDGMLRRTMMEKGFAGDPNLFQGIMGVQEPSRRARALRLACALNVMVPGLAITRGRRAWSPWNPAASMSLANIAPGGSKSTEDEVWGGMVAFSVVARYNFPDSVQASRDASVDGGRPRSRR